MVTIMLMMAVIMILALVMMMMMMMFPTLSRCNATSFRSSSRWSLELDCLGERCWWWWKWGRWWWRRGRGGQKWEITINRNSSRWFWQLFDFLSRDEDDDDNDDVDDSTRSIAIEGCYASVLHGNRLRWPFDLGRVWWSKDMRGILFFSGGINFSLFFFHCRFGGKKEERWSFDIFGESFVFAAFFFHCGEIFSSSGEIIFLLFFSFQIHMVRE